MGADFYFCSHRLLLARGLQRAGYQVVVLTHVIEDGDRIRREGFKLIESSLRRGGLNPFQDLRSLVQTVGTYRAERPDLAHHVGIKPILYGSIASAITATPATVNAFAGTGYLFNSQRPIARAVSAMVSRLMKALLSRARSRVILQNAEAGDSMVASGMVSRDRLVIIRGSGVDLAEYTPSPEPAGTPVVVLASRMLWDKGVREFVQAARILRAQSVRVRMALVGAPDPANPSAIATSELESWRDEGIVEWWGHRRDMPSVFAACHIVCLPSYHEGLPKVLIEGAACGRPLIASDIAGCREVVKHMENGLLVKVKDAEGLAAAIRDLAEDGKLRRSLGANGRRLAVDNFSIDRVIDQTRALYDELLTA